jgi:hypothetical protein
MEEMDLNITGFLITEQSESQHNLYLKTKDMFVDNVYKRLGDNVKLVFHEGAINEYSNIKLYLHDTNELVILPFDKHFVKPEYLTWLKSHVVTHISVYHFDGQKDIPHLDVKRLTA